MREKKKKNSGMIQPYFLKSQQINLLFRMQSDDDDGGEDKEGEGDKLNPASCSS